MQMEPESQSEGDYSYHYRYEQSPSPQQEPEPEYSSYPEHAYSYETALNEQQTDIESEPEELAVSLVATMMEAGLGGRSISDVVADLAPQARLADVEADVNQFKDQYEYCSENGIPIPCFEDDKGSIPLPLNLAGVVHPFASPTVHQPPDVARWLLKLLPEQVKLMAQSSSLEYSEYSPNEVREFFGHRLRQFLIPRLGTSRSESSKTADNYGLRFRVFARTDGLRIYYTPAYWFTPNQVFGAPTSPVEGWIMPGRFRFGAYGGSLSLRWDDGEYSIPPSEEARLEI